MVRKSTRECLECLQLLAVHRMIGIVGAGQMAHHQHGIQCAARSMSPSRARACDRVRPSLFIPVSIWMAQG